MTYPILNFKYNDKLYNDNGPSHDFWYEDYFGNILSKEKYRYAKSFNEGIAFVYKHDKSWDIINAVGESQLSKFKFSDLIIKILKYSISKDGFFIKNYSIESNLIIGVNWPDVKKVFNDLKIEIKYVPDNPIEHAYLVIKKDELKISLIEDYSLSGNGFIAIKHFNKNWIYIQLQSFRFHALEKKVFSQEFERAYGFRDRIAKVKQNGYYGFINTKGEFVIDPSFDDARSFFEGFAAIGVANCRKDINLWNSGKRYSDLAWNLIDKSNKLLLKESKELLTMISSNKGYYFKNNYDSMYSYEQRNLNPDFLDELSRNGSGLFSYNSIGRPSASYWYGSNIWGQLHANYIVDFLTAQISNELGFKKWFVGGSLDRSEPEVHLSGKRKVEAESIYIDFDTTQSELDYILGINSIESKYGEEYTSGNWKTKITRNYGSYSSDQMEIDWSDYNDNLDIDQQDIDFWNQF
jgi:hypothetical protein